MARNNQPKPFKVKKAQKQFAAFARSQGVEEAAQPPRRMFQVMMDFYAGVRAKSCNVEKDGDMLLYQWGTYDWGRGRHFEFDLTRQFIVGDGEDDEIFQLSLTYLFEPTSSLEALGKSNRWCNTPAGLAEFRGFVEASPAYMAVADRTDARVELDFEIAG